MKTLKILKHIDPKKYGLSNWKILEGKMFPLDKSIEGKFEWKLIEYTLDNVNIEGAKFLCPQGWELGRIEHLHSIDPKILLKEREGVEALKYALIMAMGSTEVGVGNSTTSQSVSTTGAASAANSGTSLSATQDWRPLSYGVIFLIKVKAT
jgi:hypothetical protein